MSVQAQEAGAIVRRAPPPGGSTPAPHGGVFTHSDRASLLALIEARNHRQSRRRIQTFYPDTGALRRDLYPQHLEFFRIGRETPTRAFVAANRVGKTEGAGGYEMTCHLTGIYPEWWEGRRFTDAVDCWAAGDTKETVRDIIQLKMVGPEGAYGTGMIPGDLIVNHAKRPNGNGALDFVTVKHRSGGVSRLGFKSYDQGREAFQGTEKHVIWLDEESNEGVRAECVMRLMTTNGLLIETFTPLRGLTPIVMTYLGDDAAIPEGRVSVGPERAMVMAGWDDVPHLDADQKRRMLAEAEPHLREARSKGIPSIGQGAIYPVPEEQVVVDDFAVPAHWPRGYGLDVGWNRTAAVWGAMDRDADVLYLYSEHYQGQQEPSTHVAGIQARGKHLVGAIDPASRGRSQKDGEQLLVIYRALGLQLLEADNSRESGLYEVHQRLATGRLKVFRSLRNWWREYRIYRRDEKGHIVKQDDHLMDACLTGDTMVCTDRGVERIDSLIGKGGRVLSRAGAMCEFIGARKTIIGAPIVRVEFEDGSAVSCTPDHTFLTPGGWVEARDLRGQRVYNAATQRGAKAMARDAAAARPSAARVGTARRLALTMRNALAWCAAAASWRIATLGRPRARDAALLSCAAVRSAGQADVYCLTVPGTDAFAVGPGVVVHNTRYLVVSGIPALRVSADSSVTTFRRLRGYA